MGDEESDEGGKPQLINKNKWLFADKYIIIGAYLFLTPVGKGNKVQGIQ